MSFTKKRIFDDSADSSSGGGGVTPLIYKALLSQNDSVASQTSGTVPVGSIWTLETYVGGTTNYTIQVTQPGLSWSDGQLLSSNIGAKATIVSIIENMTDVFTIVISVISGNWPSSSTVGAGNSPLTLYAIDSISAPTVGAGDDFSNWELLSGTLNTSGSVYQATSSAPTDWSHGSDLSYDGSPYVVSTNSNGEYVPFVNTIGNIVWSRISIGNFYGTLIGAFPENKIFLSYSINMPAPNGVIPSINFYRFDNDKLYLNTYDELASGYDNMLNHTPITIEVYP